MANITEAQVQQYKANVIHLYQQMESKLRGTTRYETLKGEAHFFERLAPSEMEERTTQHGDTPLGEGDWSRRKVTLRDFEWARLVDNQDKIRLLVSPESEYAINAAKAMNRNYDRIVIEAFTADAFAGKAGQTPVTFASEALFDLDISAAIADSDDVRTVKAAFDNAEIPEEDRYALVTPDFILQLLADTKVISSDFNTVKALADGKLNTTWMSFKWIVSTLCPLAAGGDRFCLFWHKDAMGAVTGAEPNVRMSERDDKSYAVQVYASRTMGATRIQPGVGRLQVKAGIA
jgi:hypothetical protein